MSGDVSRQHSEQISRLDPCWPVLPGPRYRGLVWNHRSLKDGTLITTSAVVELKDGRIVTRSGSMYELGRTYYSEQHAAEQSGLRLGAYQRHSSRAPQVIDLESEDLSALDTFINEKLPDAVA